MNETESVKLTQEQTLEALEAIRVLDRLLPQVDDLSACGVDCQARRQRIQQRKQQLENLVNRFGYKE